MLKNVDGNISNIYFFTYERFFFYWWTWYMFTKQLALNAIAIDPMISRQLPKYFMHVASRDITPFTVHVILVTVEFTSGKLFFSLYLIQQPLQFSDCYLSYLHSGFFVLQEKWLLLEYWIFYRTLFHPNTFSMIRNTNFFRQEPTQL